MIGIGDAGGIGIVQTKCNSSRIAHVYWLILCWCSRQIQECSQSVKEQIRKLLWSLPALSPSVYPACPNLIPCETHSQREHHHWTGSIKGQALHCNSSTRLCSKPAPQRHSGYEAVHCCPLLREWWLQKGHKGL